MMRILLIIFLFISTVATAQEKEWYKKTIEIANNERDAHMRIPVGEPSSLASDNFDVKYYRCEWEVDPAIRYIKGKVTVYFTVSSAASSITLDLMSALTVDSVKRRGANVGYSQPSNTVLLNFAPALTINALDSVSIYYKGVPPNTGFGSFIQDNHAGTPMMWSLSEPYGSRDWWPCKNNLGDKADSIDVMITHPSQYKAASNGLLQSETPIAGGKTVTHWKHRYPIASYLMCFAVTNYAVFNNTVQLGNTTLPMQTYCYPESLAEFQANTPKVLEAMQLFHRYFGDYPFIKEKYGHVQFNWGGGMEHQTSTFIINTDEALMAHELGHQWFGDKITSASWEDIWLNEGFATFLAAFHMETKYPASRLANRKAVIDYITGAPGGVLKVADTLNVGQIFDFRLTYNKGSYLLNMLRFKLGDSVFFKALRRYQQDPAVIYHYARNADLKRNLEGESGQDLTKFFQQWYEGQGYPSYKVQWSQLGSSAVNIRMSQVTSHSSVSFFEMPVALKFKNATQEKTIVVNNTINGQTFVQQVGFIPDTVLIDPELWLISKNNSTEKINLSNTGQGKVEIYPNPATDPVTVFLHDFATDAAAINIYNAAGQLVYQKNIPLVNGAELLTLRANSWARGMYIVKVKAGNDTFVQQIIR